MVDETVEVPDDAPAFGSDVCVRACVCACVCVIVCGTGLEYLN